MKIPEKIKDYMEKLNEAGFEAYIVGGACRDYFLGTEPVDYDIFTNAPGEKLLEIFPKGKVIGGEERQKKILTVVVDGTEISQFRESGDRTKTGNDLYTHQSTCDFTINSIACDRKGKFIDPFGGIKDINKKIIRAVGNPIDRINEDKLRILRAIRFSSKYNLKIGKWLSEIIKTTSLKNIPSERIKEELLKIIIYPSSIKNLLEYGILLQIIPDFGILLPLSGGEHHGENVGEHSIIAHKKAIELTNNPLLILACLLHDIGKSRTSEIRNGKRIFHNHDKIGAEITRNLLKRLKFANIEIEYISFLVEKHMFGYTQDIKNKTYIKFLNQLKEKQIAIEDFIILLYCDNQANKARPRIKFGDFLKNNPIYKKYIELLSKKTPFGVRNLEINGNDLIEIGIEQGPEVGKTLNLLLNEVQEGKIANIRGELIRRVKKIVVVS